MAHKIDLLTDHEITTANTLPNVIPDLITSD